MVSGRRKACFAVNRAREFKTTTSKSGMYLKLLMDNKRWSITAIRTEGGMRRVLDAGEAKTPEQIGMLMTEMANISNRYGVQWIDVE